LIFISRLYIKSRQYNYKYNNIFVKQPRFPQCQALGLDAVLVKTEQCFVAVYVVRVMYSLIVLFLNCLSVVIPAEAGMTKSL